MAAAVAKHLPTGRSKVYPQSDLSPRPPTLHRSHEAGTPDGQDTEDLHDMRVAIRRLRAALRCFQDVLPPAAVQLDEELGWLAGRLASPCRSAV